MEPLERFYYNFQEIITERTSTAQTFGLNPDQLNKNKCNLVSFTLIELQVDVVTTEHIL